MVLYDSHTIKGVQQGIRAGRRGVGCTLERGGARILLLRREREDQRHPWLASVAWGTPPPGPNSLRQDELTTAAMSSLGVGLQTQGAVSAAVYFFVIGFVLR